MILDGSQSDSSRLKPNIKENVDATKMRNLRNVQVERMK